MKTFTGFLKSTILITLLLITHLGYAQQWEWAKGTYGMPYETEDVAADTSGNVFLVHFDGYDYPPFEDRRLIVSKKNAQGTLIWAKVIVYCAQPSISFNSRITTDNAGNVYLLGQYQSIIQVGNITLQTSNPSSDLKYTFIAKLDTQGNVLWAKNVAGPTVENPESGVNDRDIAIDPQGNIVITGAVKGNAYFDGLALLTSNPNPTAFVAKYSNNGDVIWAQRVKLGQSYGGNLDTDSEGNVYATGYFYGTTGWIPWGNTYFAVTSPGIVYYLTKLSPRGSVSWSKVLNPNEEGYCIVSGLAASGNGNFFITGHFGGTYNMGDGISITTTSPGNADIMVAGYNNNGNLQWARSAGSTKIDYGYDIDVDQQGHCYIVGAYQEVATFDTKVLSAVPSGGVAGFLARYSSNGIIHWVEPIFPENFSSTYRISTTPQGAGYVLSYNEHSNGLTFGSDITLNLTNYNDIVAKVDGNAKKVKIVEIDEAFICFPCFPYDPVLDYEYRFWQEMTGIKDAIYRKVSNPDNQDEVFRKENRLEIRLHDELPRGTYFFQLRAILRDGTITDWTEALSFKVEGSTKATLIYPNPVKEKLTIEYQTSKIETLLITLYDRYGKLLLKEEKEAKEGKNTLELNIPVVKPDANPLNLQIQSKFQGTSAWQLIKGM